jgi:hypothetical protein
LRFLGACSAAFGAADIGMGTIANGYRDSFHPPRYPRSPQGFPLESLGGVDLNLDI